MKNSSSNVINTIKTLLKRFVTWANITPFGYLNGTQFLGAMNDNIFKLLIVFCFISLKGHQASNTILASVGAIYVIPFLLLSSTAGTMADRFSKRSIIVMVKIAELVVMVLGFIAFYLGSMPLAYSALFLLACHSAIFAPCKYGIVPEIVPKEGIARANGILTSCTYTAIIVGTFLASFLTDVTGHNFLLASLIGAFFALIGLLLSLQIPKTAPSGSQKKISPRFINELFCNLRLIVKEPTLLSSVLGSAFFLFVGSYTQLNMIPFALTSLGLSDVHGGYLFLLTALGIGTGALLAGKISGKRVELGFVPIGGFGIALCFFLLYFCQSFLAIEVLLVILVGLFGGLYLVPFDSYIQLASPNMLRGQVIATTNFLGFFGVLCSAGLLYFLSEIVGFQPAQGFLAMGFITLTFVIGITIAISGHVVRFIFMLLSNRYYKAIVHNRKKLVDTPPALFLTTLPFWPWSVMLVGCQSRRMRLFVIEGDTQSGSLAQRLMLKFAHIHKVTALEALPDYELLIENSLLRGTSVALFVPYKDASLLEMIKSNWPERFQSALFLFQKRTGGRPFEAEICETSMS